MSKVINTELKSDSESDLDLEKLEAKVDDELEKSGSDSVPIFFRGIIFFSPVLLWLKIHKHFNQFNLL